MKQLSAAAGISVGISLAATCGLTLFPLGLSASFADAPSPIEKSSPTAEGAPPMGAPEESPASEVQERAIPGVVAPGPSGIAPPPRFVGPTENLTKVANALGGNHKSLTTLITFKAGFPVTRPVEISIGYYSQWKSQRITQSYVASAGNRFLYNDDVGDGKPRRLHLDINLSEPKPGGGAYTFHIPMDMDLDPLYDVAIGPLTFSLLSNCDAVGDSEIAFEWYSPEGLHHRYGFNMQAGGHLTLDLFSWRRTEVSASAKLHQPSLMFRENDPLGNCLPGGCPFAPSIAGSDNLVPGMTRQVVTTLKEALRQHCSAKTQYNITYTLRWYPIL